MTRVSMKMIAEHAGVSRPTVSEILNHNKTREGSVRISDATREKVLKIARKLEYTPNYFAKALKTGRTNIIGVTGGLHVPIRRVFNDPYFANLYTGIGDVAADKGYRLLFQQNDTSGPDTSLEMISSKMVDGVVFVLMSEHVDDFLQNQLPRLRKLDVPYTVVTTFPELPGVPTAGVDAHKGAYDCTLHLLEHGYRDVGFLFYECGENRFNSALKAGFDAALAEKEIDPASVVMLPSARVYGDGGYGAVETLLASGRTIPRALFCTDLRMAWGALKRLKEAGITVPDRCAVGVYGIEMKEEYLTSTLTVSRAPVEETGRAAMQMLLEKIAGKSVENRIQEPVLHIRQSCGCNIT